MLITEMSSPPVEILLLTCNRRPHLQELLNSLLAQKYPNWRIIARDNGSSDGSFDGLAEFQRRYPERMDLQTDDRRVNLGPVEGFARLLMVSTAPYSMFCDCDDVWLPEKVDRTLSCMTRLEKCFSPDTPLLVHTELRVVNASLATIADSFFRHQGLHPRPGRSLNRLLVQNHVTGCTVAINKPLRDLSLPIPTEAIMHDWWLALVAAAFGHIAFVSEPTILYRQHGQNTLGAREWNARYVLRKMLTFYDTRDFQRSLDTTVAQAGKFLERYENRLDRTQQRVVRAYTSLPEAGWFARRIRILRCGLLKHGLIRNIRWLLQA